jgi:hypothetical protein
MRLPLLPLVSAPGQAESPLHKLNLICPSLYNSLSEAEKDSLLSFHWLSRHGSDSSPPLREDALHPSPDLPDLSTFCPPQVSDALPSIPASSPSTVRQPLSPPFSVEPEALPMVPPGFGQSDEVDSNLLDALTSSTSLTLLPENTPQLSIYRGKELIRPAAEVGSSTSHNPEKAVKAFAWSRGIGTELSPLQTRSSRKQKELLNSVQNVPDFPSQEGKALRALKALARSK